MSQIATPSLAPSATPPAAPATPAPSSTPPSTPPSAPPPTPAAPATPPVASNATPPATPVAQATAPDPSVISLSPASSSQGGERYDTKSIFSRAGLDPRQVADDYLKNGNRVSPEHIRLLKSSNKAFNMMGDGFDELAELLVRGSYAEHRWAVHEAQTATKAAVEAAGGESQLEVLKTWFAANQPDRVKSFEAMLKNDPSVYPDIVRIMASEYAAKAGAAGAKPIVTGQPGASVAGAKPTSHQEMSSLMQKVMSGDRAALATLNSMSDAEIKAFG